MDRVRTLAALLPPGSFIYGIPRGGCVVAALLSFQNPALLQAHPHQCPIILIDDIADSGKTLAFFQGLGYKTAALYKRASCPIEPDWVAEEMKPGDNAWLVFPWEETSND